MIGLQVVLGGLAAYHLGIGMISAFFPEYTPTVIDRLYGFQLSDALAFRWASKMLGLFALVFGGLLANAALNPGANRPVIVALIALQSLRAIFRLTNRQLLANAFKVTDRNNGMAVTLLIIEITLLIDWFPPG